VQVQEARLSIWSYSRYTILIPRMERLPPRWLRPLMDSGPLAMFFVTYAGWDLFIATAAMLLATFITLVLSYSMTRQVPATVLASAAMLTVFGGLTLWLRDEDYLKLQATLLPALFSLVLFASVLSGRQLLGGLFGASLPISAEGWRLLTVRCAIFFAALAALNEAIARTQSTSVWVGFNVFGTTTLALVFAVAHWRFMKRHGMAPVNSDRCN